MSFRTNYCILILVILVVSLLDCSPSVLVIGDELHGDENNKPGFMIDDITDVRGSGNDDFLVSSLHYDNDVDDDDYEEIPTLLRSLQSAPVPAPTVDDDTASPTISMLPTYSEKCYVCGSETSYVQNIYNAINFFTESFLCGDLESAGRAGIVTPDACPLAQQAVMTGGCGCMEGVTVSPAGIPTISPSISPKPTSTPKPTQLFPCYLCGESQFIHNQSAVITIFKEPTTCGLMEEFGEQIGFPLEVCTQIGQAVYDICGCTDTQAPTPLDTIAPTITAVPTITAQPTYQDKCYLCDNDPDQEFINDPTETLIMDGTLYNCLDLQKSALQGLLTDAACVDIIDRNIYVLEKERNPKESGCTCIPKPSPGPPTMKPTKSPSIPVPILPSSSSSSSSSIQASMHYHYTNTVIVPGVIICMFLLKQYCL